VYIDNQTITVDAILTKKGRELFAQNGNLNITLFAFQMMKLIIHFINRITQMVVRSLILL